MIKKTLYVVVGALVLIALIALMWLWIAPKQQAPSGTGTFGSASDRSGSGTTGAGAGTNLGTSLGQTGQKGGRSSGGSTGQSTTGSGGGVGAGITTGPGGVSITGGGTSQSSGISGVTWVNSGAGGALSGSGRVFTPSEINQLNSANGGLPNLISSGSGQGGIGLGTALLAAGVTGALTCGAQALFATGAASAGGATAAGAVGTAAGSPGILSKDIGAQVLLGFIATNQSTQTGVKIAQEQRSFSACILNTIAKVALQQMTASIVNWINSGFNGKPGFVQNYQQFFTNVADQAAGEFIRGSGLAFLCSPFRPQVRIAIAKAYANRNAQSCSLTSIMRNANSFMNGNFSSGGWPGFLTFTTAPINNPYGSYSYAQISLGNYQANKVLEQSTRLAQGQGFLPVTKQKDCQLVPTSDGSGAPREVCREVIVTPGKTIADSISKTLGQGQDQLGLANSIDQILNALVTQLMTQALYNGLAGNNSVGVDPAQQAALNQAQALLNEMQATANIAQQYGSIKQGAIGDMQQVQQNFNTTYNCWSTKIPPSTQNAATAQAQIDTLQRRIDLLNGAITRANASIAQIQEFQTELALATTPAGVAAVASSFAAAKASGAFLTQSDVTIALQDRETLQAEMTSLNNQASTQLSQCRAL
ncbi:MAG: hypothetical protein AAB449_01075 [Patescibacteria group bacterium]